MDLRSDLPTQARDVEAADREGQSDAVVEHRPADVAPDLGPGLPRDLERKGQQTQVGAEDDDAAADRVARVFGRHHDADVGARQRGRVVDAVADLSVREMRGHQSRHRPGMVDANLGNLRAREEPGFGKLTMATFSPFDLLCCTYSCLASGMALARYSEMFRDFATLAASRVVSPVSWYSLVSHGRASIQRRMNRVYHGYLVPFLLQTMNDRSCFRLDRVLQPFSIRDLL